ncbi:MAG TPA: response regulator [Puia sp.]|jgi:DNA-binding response OmpR family regulator|nr:response regulator [Puia sp.]
MDHKLIYLIDDSPVIITRLRSLLKDLDFAVEIRSAGAYESAEALLSERIPDLVLLDINLGKRSGIELLQFIRERYPTVTVIVVSNQSGPRHRAICRDLGAAHFIDKSTEFSQIRALVTSYCQP